MKKRYVFVLTWLYTAPSMAIKMPLALRRVAWSPHLRKPSSVYRVAQRSVSGAAFSRKLKENSFAAQLALLQQEVPLNPGHQSEIAADIAFIKQEQNRFVTKT